MSREEMFVDGDLLDADYPNPRFEFNYLVDKQERITVRKDLLNGARIVNCHRQN
jgi:hypothetical protein